jgi:hypothetical protein
MPEAERLRFEPNILAQRGSALFQKFAERMLAHRANDLALEIAIHGTRPTSVASILRQGMDPKRFCRQALGPGFYFSREISMSSVYSAPVCLPFPPGYAPNAALDAVETRKVIVFALLPLPTVVTVHRANTVVVVTDERYTLPLGVLTVPCSDRLQRISRPGAFEYFEPITARFLARKLTEAHAKERALQHTMSPEELAARMAERAAHLAKYMAERAALAVVGIDDERETAACAAVLHKVKQGNIEDASDKYLELLAQAPDGAALPWAASIANSLLSLEEAPFERGMMAVLFPGAFEALREVNAAAFPPAENSESEQGTQSKSLSVEPPTPTARAPAQWARAQAKAGTDKLSEPSIERQFAPWKAELWKAYFDSSSSRVPVA